MYKNIHNYTPFQHDNLEYKNNIINFGRNQDKTKVEGAFSAVLIYANLVDYLAKNLLENLLQMISIQSFHRFGGTFFYDGSTKKINKPLGTLREELNFFEFPDKQDFLECLKQFNSLRKGLIHELMQLNPSSNTKNIDEDIKKIQEIAEDILKKYTTICNGITTIWNASSSPQATQTPEGQSTSAVKPQQTP